MWERAPPYASLGGGGAGVTPRVFNVTAIVRINQQPVLYTPPVSEVLQAGWNKVSAIILRPGVNYHSGLFFTLWSLGLWSLQRGMRLGLFVGLSGP